MEHYIQREVYLRKLTVYHSRCIAQQVLIKIGLLYHLWVRGTIGCDIRLVTFRFKTPKSLSLFN